MPRIIWVVELAADHSEGPSVFFTGKRAAVAYAKALGRQHWELARQDAADRHELYGDDDDYVDAKPAGVKAQILDGGWTTLYQRGPDPADYQIYVTRVTVYGSAKEAWAVNQ